MTSSEVKNYASEMFSKLNSNIHTLIFAKNNNDAEKQKQCLLIERKIINDMLAADIEQYNCFMSLMLAEYKEKTYWSICDIHFEKAESAILHEYKRIITGNCIWDLMSKAHKHNPNHFMFKGTHYKFYDALEVMGHNILDMTKDEVIEVLHCA
jgi:hypothetical protein